VTRRLACVLVIVAAVGLVAVVRASAAPRDDSGATSLIEAARSAVTSYAFTGVVTVEWLAGGTVHRQRVPVRDEGGVLVLGSSQRVMDTGSESLVHEAEGWLGSSADEAPDAAPRPADHYELSVSRGTTTVVTAVSRADRAVQERLYFDDATGLLLRREELDGTRTERAVGFVEISDPTAKGAPTNAPPRDARTATRVSTKKIARGWDVPRALRDGFELVDVYRRPGGGLQLYYSDGLVGMSVFEEKGSLETDALPRGGYTTKVGGRETRVYETAGGRTVVWGADDIVYACVTDAPARTLDALASTLPSHRGNGIVARVTHFVLGPFSWE
jgi:hypothetical protein